MTKSAAVLPVLQTNPRLAHIKSMDDLLSPEQRQALYDDLAEMAKQRRRAEAEAAFIVLH